MFHLEHLFYTLVALLFSFDLVPCYVSFLLFLVMPYNVECHPWVVEPKGFVSWYNQNNGLRTYFAYIVLFLVCSLHDSGRLIAAPNVHLSVTLQQKYNASSHSVSSQNNAKVAYALVQQLKGACGECSRGCSHIKTHAPHFKNISFPEAR